MGKKKNNKFKKKKHQFINASTSFKQTANISSDDGETEVTKENIDLEEIEAKDEKEEFYQTDQYAHVKKDIQKILIIMSSIIIVLFGVYYLSLKTSYLNVIGDWIYKVTNIQTQ